VAGTERFFWYSTPSSTTLNAFDRTNQGVNWNNDVPPDDSDTVTNQNINAQGGNTQTLISTDDWTRILSNFDFGLSVWSIGSAAGNVTENDPDAPPAYNPDEECSDAPTSESPPLFEQSFTTGCREVTAMSEPDSFDPPLKQVKTGVAPEDVKCNGDLKLVLKSDKPACVKDSSLGRLLANGWKQP